MKMYENEDLLCGTQLVNNGHTPFARSLMPNNKIEERENKQQEHSLSGFLEISINLHTQYGAMHMDHSQLDRDVAAHTRDLHLTI